MKIIGDQVSYTLFQQLIIFGYKVYRHFQDFVELVFLGVSHRLGQSAFILSECPSPAAGQYWKVLKEVLHFC